ncbi:hypothetical protein TI39_contig492g00005 [Zymoseptoria brevis]|uniref:Uncharacterized protein n=1 Tax=Zymoseptoria brevis TaxID=1047168 RepID=A0A0F4GJ39_9PEZI|nr:hypothetical protein TI39_contig492g00005 [Zymoseptoria brevis]
MEYHSHFKNRQQCAKWQEDLRCLEERLEIEQAQLHEDRQKYDSDQSRLTARIHKSQHREEELKVWEQNLEAWTVEREKQQEELRQQKVAISEGKDLLGHESEFLRQQDSKQQQREEDLDRRAADVEAMDHAARDNAERVKGIWRDVERRMIELQELEVELDGRAVACERREAKAERDEREARFRGRGGGSSITEEYEEDEEFQGRGNGRRSSVGCCWPPSSSSSASREAPASDDEAGLTTAHRRDVLGAEKEEEHGDYQEAMEHAPYPVDDAFHIASKSPGQLGEASDLLHRPLTPLPETDICEIDASTDDDPTVFMTAGQLLPILHRVLLPQRQPRRDGVLSAMRLCAEQHSQLRPVGIDWPALPNTLPDMPAIRAEVLDVLHVDVETDEAFQTWQDELIRADQEDAVTEGRLLALFEQICKAGLSPA